MTFVRTNVFQKIVVLTLLVSFGNSFAGAQEARLDLSASPSRAAMEHMALARAEEPGENSRPAPATASLAEGGAWGRREWMIFGGVALAVIVVVAVIVANSGDEDGGGRGGNGGGGTY